MHQFVNQLQQLEQQLASLSQEIQTVTSKLSNVTAQIQQSANLEANRYAGTPTTRRNYMPTHSYGSQYMQGGSSAQPYGANYVSQNRSTASAHGATQSVMSNHPQSQSTFGTTGSLSASLKTGVTNSANTAMTASTDYGNGQGTQSQVNMSALQSILSADGTARSAASTGRQSEHTSYGRVY